MSKKAQMISQVFVFVIAALLFGLVLFFGYRAISQFIDVKDDVVLIGFKNDLEKQVRQVKSSFGTTRTSDLRLPAKYTELCVVDLNIGNHNKKILEDNHPLIASLIQSKSQNVFTSPPLEIPILLDPITVRGVVEAKQSGKSVNGSVSAVPGYVCVDVINGVSTLGFRGIRASVEIFDGEDI